MALLMQAACTPASRRKSSLTQHRNLGKAFYENPTTKQEAVREFQQGARTLPPDSAREKLNYALALLPSFGGYDEEAVRRLQQVQHQDPSLPHTWFNLGIYYKRQGDANRAISQFEGMRARAPLEAIGHYQLGALYRQVNRNAEAQASVREPRRGTGSPLLAAAPFQLYNLYRTAGNIEQANRHLADFQRVQTAQKGWVIPEDVEWCVYAEIYDPPAAHAESAALPEPTFTDIRGWTALWIRRRRG